MSDFKKLAEGLNSIINELSNQSQTILDKDVPEVLALLKTVRDMDDNMKYLKSRYGELAKELKEVIVPKKFEEEAITSITVDGFRYTVSKSSRTSITKEQREAAYIWLREMGLQDLIAETVNSSTLSAAARDLMEEGIDLPEDLFRVYFFDNTSVTKVK